MASSNQPNTIGITVLYEGTPSTVDIVCVHGLNSTPQRCWQKGNVLWLRDLLPEAIDSARIATFGFNSSVMEEASTAKIRDHSRDLLQDLKDWRQDEEAQRPIIFVCHSLGGIVVKQALVMAQQQSKFEVIKKATYGIVFLGTPHRGSDLASLGQTMAKIAKAAFKHPEIHLLKVLEANSLQLQELSEQFTELHALFRIVTCFEQKQTVFGKGIFQKREMVVPEFSAKLEIQGEALVAMNTDHHSICKFGDASDNGYIRVKNRIVELAKEAPEVVRTRFKPEPKASLGSVSLNQLSLVPELPLQGIKFYGREVELERLHSYFSGLGNKRKLAVLWGLGGMGKTQLALRYQENHRLAYASVFWIQSMTEEDIVISFQSVFQNLISGVGQIFPAASQQQIAQSLGITRTESLLETPKTTRDAQMIINALKAFLARKDNQDWLLIFDSWDSTDKINIRSFFPHSAHGHIMITTRQKDSGDLGLSLEVASIKKEAAARLLLNRISPEVSQSDAPTEDIFRDAQELSMELGGAPLALEQAEAYLFFTKIQILDYLTMLKGDAVKLLEDRLRISEWAYEKNEPIFQTLEITLLELATKHPDTCNLLSFLAFLNPSRITYDILEELLSSNVPKNSLFGQASKGLEALQELCTRQIHFDKAKVELSRFCLVQTSPMQKTRRLEIHPLVHQWSRLRLDMQYQQQISVAVALSLAIRVGKKEKGAEIHWALTQRLSPHVDFSLKQLHRLGTINEAENPSGPWFQPIQFILEQFAYFYWKGGNLIEAVQLYERVAGGMQICGDSIGGHLRLPDVREDLGRVLWELGEFDKAEKFVKSAFDGKVEIYGLEHDSVLEISDFLRKVVEKKNDIARMEERSRNAASSPKAIPGMSHSNQLEMSNAEWQLYAEVEQSIELLGCNDMVTIAAIEKLGKQRYPGWEFPDGTNALQIAATSGNLIDIVQLLLHRGADVNAESGHYGNALQAAAANGHSEVVELLLQAGANVNSQGGQYGSALQAAAIAGHALVIELLLRAGADIKPQGISYDNAFWAAVIDGHDKMVQLLLTAEVDVDAENGDVFRLAVANAHTVVVQYLIAAGVDARAKSSLYSDALQAAAADGHSVEVQRLLTAGADANDNDGDILRVAAENGHAMVIQLLLVAGANINSKSNALRAAAMNGHDTVVQHLIAAGADVNANAKGGDYSNALQAAAARGHDTVVQHLIAAGADVNAEGGDYGNALQAAAISGHDTVVQHLIAAGAEINARGGFYGNALQAAAARGHDTVVQHLIAAGADINARSGHYGNALQAAAAGGHDTVVQHLIAAGADTNARGDFYGNALQAAAARGYGTVVQHLIATGADTNARGDFYGNALQVAAARGYDTVVQHLIAAGADINARGGRYGNALQAAAAGGHDTVVQHLIAAGADINARSGHYGNALQAAAAGGHDTVVQHLIAAGADADALQAAAGARAGGSFLGALSVVATNFHDAVVRLLPKRREGISTDRSERKQPIVKKGWTKRLRAVVTGQPQKDLGLPFHQSL